MQIFALDTNLGRIKKPFLASGEKEIFTVHPHVLSFIWHIAWEVVLTIALAAICSALYVYSLLDLVGAIFAFVLAWCTLGGFGLVRAFIDWKYDFIMLTTDKLIIVDQSSLFRKSITPISLENLGDVVSQTQWLNLFNFGIIRFALKEGSGEVVLKFMPDADTLVAKIAEQITLYQRRKDYVVPYRSSDATL